uniref:Endonuclease-reverse transcriptase n=1 Tax=Rhodnius prolixus TaxID=13249 RepID=T1HH99_RHOPR
MIGKIAYNLFAVLLKIKSLKEQVQSLKEENCNLRERIDNMEMLNSKNNLIFKGIPNTEETSPQKIVKEICQKVLEVEEPVMISNTFIIGNQASKRNIIKAEFALQTTVQQIFRNVKKLKGCGISIQNDFPLVIRLRRNKLLTIRRVMMKENYKTKIIIRQDKMLIGGKRFHWNDDKGRMFESKKGLNTLLKISGLDMKLVVQRLLKEDKEEQDNHDQAERRQIQEE